MDLFCTAEKRWCDEKRSLDEFKKIVVLDVVVLDVDVLDVDVLDVDVLDVVVFVVVDGSKITII